MAKVCTTFASTYIFNIPLLAQNSAKRRPWATLHQSIPTPQSATATHRHYRPARASLISKAAHTGPRTLDAAQSRSLAVSEAHRAARAGRHGRIPCRRPAQRARPNAPSGCRSPTGVVADPHRVRIRTDTKDSRHGQTEGGTYIAELRGRTTSDRRGGYPSTDYRSTQRREG